MIIGARVRERLAAAGISQSELARRVGVSQPTIANLISRSKKGSAHLHRIARELQTTPAYLSGETDDPTAEATGISDLPVQDRELIEVLGSLKGTERSVFIDMVKAYADRQNRPPALVSLPDKVTLTAMFRGILGHIDPSLPQDEQAELLAELLPIALPRTVGARSDLAYRIEEEDQSNDAKRVREPQR